MAGFRRYTFRPIQETVFGVDVTPEPQLLNIVWDNIQRLSVKQPTFCQIEIVNNTMKRYGTYGV